MWRLLFLVILFFCGYVCWRSGQALFTRKKHRIIWTVFIFLTALGFTFGRMLGDNPVAFFLRIVGMAWIITLPYWLVAVFFFDGLRLANRRFKFFPMWVQDHYMAAKRLALALTVVIVGVIFFFGYQRFAHPVTTPVQVTIHAPAGDMKTLHAAVASDLHLGDFIGRERVADYVRRINGLGADIILLPGDIIDSRLAPLREQKMGEELAKLKAPLGVFAAVGNHERIAGMQESIAFLEESGIRVLRDEAILINDSFYLVGRDDIRPRKPLDDLLAGLDRSKPVIVLDHQPHNLDEPAQAGINLQLSGHTHQGQLWPITWVVKAIYEISYGLGKKGDTYIYVSSGLGLWGLPARIGTRSEIVDLRIDFQPESKIEPSGQ
jgi:predicted MPP superfamily phosphohydrolase